MAICAGTATLHVDDLLIYRQLFLNPSFLTQNNGHVRKYNKHILVVFAVQASKNLTRLLVLRHRKVELAFLPQSPPQCVERHRHISMHVSMHTPAHAQHTLAHLQRIVMPPLLTVKLPLYQDTDPQCFLQILFRPVKILMIQQNLPSLF
mmetsp:Transcript_41769/g.97450  ORF Transcript_41769/g.97450 Transcript_41769/m.97450 type:complete len:149 (-) Transcript_41769:266-712(-)